MAVRILAALVLVVLCSAAAFAEEPAVTQDELRAAVTKSLPLLMKAAGGHREERKQCFACHQQGVPIFALTAAKARGFAIDEVELKTQLEFIAGFLAKNHKQYLEGKGTGGQADTAGYALTTLAAGGWQPDEDTAAVAEYLLLRHADRDHWGTTSNRPPTEASPLTTTYVAARGLAAFATLEQKERAGKRIEQAREWLLGAQVKDNEDSVFRLLGLAQTNAPEDNIVAAAKELLAKQREDGGWAQLDSANAEKGEPEAATKSDAYATGTALVALHQADGLATTDAAYQRGLRYLLKTQLDDGSWHVASRSKPFQAYYESGFPHGNDQFISCAASGWATWAMVLAVGSDSQSQ
jgi:mono/diheme cytochrome c family protein